MKKIWNYFIFACLLTGGTAAMAQSNSSNDRPSSPAEKNKTVAQEVKKPAGPEAVDELKTDANGRQYKMVDGRKVYTDSQGVQSLATPAPANTSKKEEVKTNSEPKK
jgi:hypothetical protein